MTRLLVCIFLGLASCQQTETHTREKKVEPVVDSMDRATASVEKKYSLDAIYQKYINRELLSYMESKHPGWSIPGQSMWYPQLFKKYKTNSSLINYVSGDFDGTGSKDYVLIVDEGKGGLAAIAFLAEDSSFKTVELTDITPFDEGKIAFALTLYKPGKYNIADPDLGLSDLKYVVFACNGVCIGTFRELYEGGDQVYYWDRGHLKSCVIEH